MQHLKMLALAVGALTILIAVIGDAPASATELCSVATTPCGGTKYGTGPKLVATNTTNALIKTSLTTFTCTSSTIKSETTTPGGATTTAVAGQSTTIEFSGCSRQGGESCTLTATDIGTATITGGYASATGNSTST